MNGTFCGDVHQLRVLFCRQRPGEFDFNIDSVHHAIPGFAFLAIGRVNAGMPERNLNVFEGNFVSPRVKADRHRSAGAEARQQIIVWIWPGIAAACAYGFIGNKMMLTRDDILFKIAGAAAHNDVRCFVVVSSGHNPESGAYDSCERVAIAPEEK